MESSTVIDSKFVQSNSIGLWQCIAEHLFANCQQTTNCVCTNRRVLQNWIHYICLFLDWSLLLLFENGEWMEFWLAPGRECNNRRYLINPLFPQQNMQYHKPDHLWIERYSCRWFRECFPAENPKNAHTTNGKSHKSTSLSCLFT